jgi:uncharacterized caspase-like protein
VIGNQSYHPQIGRLQNPFNDIDLMSRALATVGFKVLPPVKDADRDQIVRAYQQLVEQLKAGGQGSIGFLYYAGHGTQIAGENVILPVNARGLDPTELKVSGVRLSEIVDEFAAIPGVMSYIVYDACRTNLGGSRSRGGLTRGPVPVARNDATDSVFVAFSASANQAATDEGDGHALYAGILAQEIVRPGVYDQVIFSEVRYRVHLASNKLQTPWVDDRIVLKANDRPVFMPSQKRPPESLSPEQAWESIKLTNSVSALKTFQQSYGNSAFADSAEKRIKELEREPTQDNKTDYRIVVSNFTNLPVKSLHYSSCRQTNWGTNRIRTPIARNGKMEFDMHDGESDCCRDMRAEFTDGTVRERWQVNVCREAEWRLHDYRINVVNETSMPISSLNYSACRVNSWGENRLGAARIAPGAGKTFDMYDKDPDCCRDIQATFANGQKRERMSINVCREAEWQVR